MHFDIMERLIWCFIHMILLSIVIMPTLSIEVSNDGDNCVLSLVIPKDSVKSSCSDSSRHEMKLRSVEAIISQLRREISDIKVKLAYTLSPRSSSPEIAELSEKVNSLENVELSSIDKRLSVIEKKITNIDKQQKLENDLTDDKKVVSSFCQRLTRKKLVKIIKTTVKSELEGLEDKIKNSLMKEMQIPKDISGAGTIFPDEKGRTAANAQSDRLYRQYTRHGRSQNDDSPSLNIEDGNIEIISEEINPKNDEILPKTRHDGVQSAIDNEFPNIRDKTDITQSDSEFGNGMNRLFEIFRAELMESLVQQTQRVKDITSQHIATVETKMSRVVRVIEAMKKKYDKKFLHHGTNHSSEKLHGKIRELENHISTLAEGIVSMKENLFNDPIIEERFVQQQIEIENRIASKLYESNIPTITDVQNLNSQLREANKKVDLTDANFRNYRADMRIRTHFLEQNVTQLLNTIEYINETLFPDYENINIDKLHHEMEIVQVIKFVKEVKALWPYIVHNLTEKDLMDNSDREEISLKFTDILSKHSDLKKQDINIYEKISSMNYSFSVLADKITDIEKFNLKNALEQNKWVRYDFECSYGRSGCFGGKKYVRKTMYNPAKYVGVVLCSEKRYKIFLSESLNSTFLDVGDKLRGGEDHCEFVGASRRSKITVGRGEPIFETVTGYKRSNWGENPIKETLSFYTPVPPWYECGVTIP